MTLTQRKRLIWAVAILAVTGLFALLLSLALRENLQLYYTPTEILHNEAAKNHTVRLGGMVVPGSVHHDAQSMKVVFTLTDGAQPIDVHYEGILPDLFKEGQGIVALGKMQNQTFIAQEVLAKHDENYMPRALKQSMKVSDGT